MPCFPTAAALEGRPGFAAEDVLRGVPAPPARNDEPGQVRVEVDGVADSLRFYGRAVDDGGPPLVYLEGDASRQEAGAWTVFDSYAGASPHGLQVRAEQVALATGRTFVELARPGVYGSSGDHQQRRRPREVALVDAALTALKRAFGWDRIDLAGFSGGGHLVAALMARRHDVDCAVIASGNVSVRQRNRENGWAADITGYADFVDPIDLVAEVARHPPRRIIVLTDPLDRTVSAACQTAYADALRAAGLAVDPRLVPARDPTHHVLNDAALLAAAASDAEASR